MPEEMFEFLTVLPDELQAGDLIDDEELVEVHPHARYEDMYVLSFANGDAWSAWDDVPLSIIRPLTPEREAAFASLVAANLYVH